MTESFKSGDVLIGVPGSELSEVVATLAAAGFVLESPASTASPAELSLRRTTGDQTSGPADWSATLPAGVAHEINNPLSAVIANLELATQTFVDLLDPDAIRTGESMLVEATAIRQLRAEVKDALQAATHVQLLVRDSRATAPTVEIGPVDVIEVVDLAIRMAAGQVRTRAHLVRRGVPVPPVRSTALRLAQVFLNLIINAAQAIPAGQPDQHEISVTTGTDECGWVKVLVTDSGAGIAPDHLSRVFSPFFSTKSAERGTGLGLPISQRIVEALGGRIEIHSQVGQGTTVTVRLPPAGPPA